MIAIKSGAAWNMIRIKCGVAGQRRETKYVWVRSRTFLKYLQERIHENLMAGVVVLVPEAEQDAAGCRAKPERIITCAGPARTAIEARGKMTTPD